MVEHTKTDLSLITAEVKLQTQNPEVQKALLTSVFKGFQPAVMVQAITEGMIRGFDFKDFLEKNIYAIPFAGGYSLVTSVDYARKIAMRSGLAGIDEPKYEDGPDGKPLTCSVTVKRVVSGHLAEFTAKVYFNEYYKAGKNGYPSLWDSKPRTMIAKVAEMHALRKACPEELSQAYVEEEMIKEAVKVVEPFDFAPHKAKLEAVETVPELAKVWSSLPIEAKQGLVEVKEAMKNKLAPAVTIPAEKISKEKVASVAKETVIQIGEESSDTFHLTEEEEAGIK